MIPNLIDSLNLNKCLEEIHKVEEYVKLQNNKVVNTITAVGNSMSNNPVQSTSKLQRQKKDREK